MRYVFPELASSTFAAVAAKISLHTAAENEGGKVATRGVQQVLWSTSAGIKSQLQNLITFRDSYHVNSFGQVSEL